MGILCARFPAGIVRFFSDPSFCENLSDFRYDLCLILWILQYVSFFFVIGDYNDKTRLKQNGILFVGKVFPDDCVFRFPSKGIADFLFLYGWKKRQGKRDIFFIRVTGRERKEFRIILWGILDEVYTGILVVFDSGNGFVLKDSLVFSCARGRHVRDRLYRPANPGADAFRVFTISI